VVSPPTSTARAGAASSVSRRRGVWPVTSL
jgi:hypothetical protein